MSYITSFYLTNKSIEDKIFLFIIIKYPGRCFPPLDPARSYRKRPFFQRTPAVSKREKNGTGRKKTWNMEAVFRTEFHRTRNRTLPNTSGHRKCAGKTHDSCRTPTDATAYPRGNERNAQVHRCTCKPKYNSPLKTITGTKEHLTSEQRYTYQSFMQIYKISCWISNSIRKSSTWVSNPGKRFQNSFLILQKFFNRGFQIQEHHSTLKFKKQTSGFIPKFQILRDEFDTGFEILTCIPIPISNPITNLFQTLFRTSNLITELPLTLFQNSNPIANLSMRPNSRFLTPLQISIRPSSRTSNPIPELPLTLFQNFNPISNLCMRTHSGFLTSLQISIRPFSRTSDPMTELPLTLFQISNPITNLH